MRLRGPGRLLVFVLTFAAMIAPASAVAAGPSAPWDAYEPDDAPPQARSLNSKLTGAGDAPYTESRTFDAAQAAAAIWDEDWYYLDVSAQHVAANYHYIFEAIPLDDPFVDPVIELYGPHPAPGFAYVDGHTMAPPALDWGNAWQANDEGNWQSQWVLTTNNGASIDFVPLNPGRYWIRVRPYGDNLNNYHDGAGNYEFRAKVSAFTRLWGANRIETAVEISKERFPDGILDGTLMTATAHAAIVANGYNFPDALAASSLAGMVQGPILLTETGSLPAATRDELLRLDPDTVYIVGGTAAVSEGVRIAIINAFAGAGDTVTVKRVAGSDRIRTSVEIGEETMAQASVIGTPTSGFAFLCNGYNFPDALSASPMAAGNHVPILLTDGTSLHPDVVQFLSTYGITDVIIVGGTAVVSPAVEAQLVGMPAFNTNRVMRIAGADRYETSKEFASWSTGLPWPAGPFAWRVGTPGNPNGLLRAWPWQIGVATGENFPDALSAGPFCGMDWFGIPKPLLLTPGNDLTDWVAETTGPNPNTSYLEDVSSTGWWVFDRSYIFGGSAAVSDQVWWQLDSQT